MSEPRLVLEWEQTPEQTWGLMRRLLEARQSRRRKAWTMLWKVAALAVLGYFIFAGVGFGWRGLGAMATFASPILFLRQQSFWLMRLSLQATGNWRHPHRVRLTLNADGLRAESVDAKSAMAHVRWATLREFRHDMDGMVLTTGGCWGRIVIIPSLAFQSSDEQAAVEEIILHHAPQLVAERV